MPVLKVIVGIALAVDDLPCNWHCLRRDLELECLRLNLHLSRHLLVQIQAQYNRTRPTHKIYLTNDTNIDIFSHFLINFFGCSVAYICQFEAAKIPAQYFLLAPSLLDLLQLLDLLY